MFNNLKHVDIFFIFDKMVRTRIKRNKIAQMTQSVFITSNIKKSMSLLHQTPCSY